MKAVSLKPEAAREIAYYIAALADSNDRAERQRLAQKLTQELGLTAEQMEEASETRQGVLVVRSRRQMREHMRRRQMAAAA